MCYKELSTRWTDHLNGENILQVHKPDGVTAIKWTDNHNHIRTAHNLDGSPENILQVRKPDGVTATKWTDDHDGIRTVHKVDGSPKR